MVAFGQRRRTTYSISRCFLLAGVTISILQVKAQEIDDNSTSVSPTACTVCQNGSSISKPEALLDVPGFGTLSCGSIDALVGDLYNSDDSNCQLLQSVSSICGCPGAYDGSNNESSCQLCANGVVPESKHNLPLSYLDDVVNYEGVNCRLLEAYFESSLEASEPTCQLGQAWTQDYCCSSAEWKPPSNPCQVSVDASDAVIDFGQELTCSQLQEAAATLWDESDSDCAEIKSITSVTCGSQSGEEPAEVCSLCKDGSSVTSPERLVPFMADRFFGIEPTCQQVQAATALLALGSSECEEVQLIGSYCGCPAVENACAFCAAGDTITTPTRQHAGMLERFDQSVTCEQLEAVLLQYPEDSDECFLAQETNWECGCNDGFYGYFGTESTADQKRLMWTTRIIGILSICGSLFIIQDFFRRGDRQNVYRQIMALMACFDFTTAMSWAIGSLSVPSKDILGNDSNILGAMGNDGLCTAQGFFIMLGYGSLFFNNSLSVYYMLVVVYNWKEHQLQKARKWLLGLPVLASFGLAFGAIPFYQHDWVGCYIRPQPYTDHHAASGFTVAPIVLTSIVSTICQIRVYLSVRATVRKALKWSMDRRIRQGSTRWQSERSLNINGDDQQSLDTPRKSCCQDAILLQDNAESAVFWQSTFYLTVYYLCWPILAYAMQNAESQDFAFWLAVGAIGSMQGFLNCLVYVRPRFMQWRRARRKQQEMRRKNIKSGAAITSSHCQVTNSMSEGFSMNDDTGPPITAVQSKTSMKRNDFSGAVHSLSAKAPVELEEGASPSRERVRFDDPLSSVEESENFARKFPSLA
eukprot:scaffold3725_cov114-Cylindrotheca_fusiformis.AAC.6